VRLKVLPNYFPFELITQRAGGSNVTTFNYGFVVSTECCDSAQRLFPVWMAGSSIAVFCLRGCRCCLASSLPTNQVFLLRIPVRSYLYMRNERLASCSRRLPGYTLSKSAHRAVEMNVKHCADREIFPRAGFFKSTPQNCDMLNAIFKFKWRLAVCMPRGCKKKL